MDLGTLKAFEAEIRKIIPKFEVRFKDQSFSQKALGFLSYPFNPKYMTRYTTTVYPYVYFPSKERYETHGSSLTVLAHELVHLVDMKKRPLWMRLSYALPQALGLLPLAAFAILGPTWLLALVVAAYLLGCTVAKKSLGLFWGVTLAGIVAASVLAVLLSGPLSALLFAGLALLAPWPSRWRSMWEMRGYAMNIAMMQWTFGSVPDLLKQSVYRKFVTSAYYFMSWGREKPYAQVEELAKQAQSGALQREFPYSVVHNFLAVRGLLKK